METGQRADQHPVLLGLSRGDAGPPHQSHARRLMVGHDGPVLQRSDAGGEQRPWDRFQHPQLGRHLRNRGTRYLSNQGQGATGLPGNYKIGAYFDSNGYPDLSSAAQAEIRGNYGVYMLVDQMVYREAVESTRG